MARKRGSTIALTRKLPTALAEPASPSHDLVVQRTGRPPRLLSSEHIATLHAMSQHVAIEHDDREWTGPLLWDVLADSGAVDPAKPAEAVRLAVRVVGADGWTAVFGLAELSLQFAAKPTQLADRMNGAPISDHALRLIVPDEHRGGRSVRDVVRIDVE